MTTNNNWLESARRLMSELSQQPIETQQAMQELSRKSYPENPFEHDLHRMQFLEGSLSSSHIQSIRSNSTGMDDYLSNLESEYSAHCKALEEMQRGFDADLAQLVGTQELLHTPTDTYWKDIFGE